ncbi:hypothetical protein KIN20_017306 [Parelaphostrongylus tenuis]|uniref:Uncharacterized protein n=1 Tax=Parelaphostrongylus tenuis TaxID=148309 RepID=A0AAD5MHS4_PARTN|nr:hypothetical protein KIN20_017306 [Parelaphostrongylus tenuis]
MQDECVGHDFEEEDSHRNTLIWAKRWSLCNLKKWDRNERVFGTTAEIPAMEKALIIQ